MIPKIIYQSWKTKKLDPKMEENVSKLRSMNPEYEYALFDDDDCRMYLLDNFGENYANAFDSLIPGAFKCDFWRYAILYKQGGVYIDIDMVPEKPLSEILKDSYEFVSVVDRPWHGMTGIYQAFLACVPGHPILLTSLELSFANIVSRKDADISNLCITGPCVVGTAMNLFWNRLDTNTPIKPGKYKNGIFLYDFNGKIVTDKDGDVIFRNKFDGYTGGSYDSRDTDYYKNDSVSPLRKRQFTKSRKFEIAITILIVIGFLLSFIFYKKWKTCSSRDSN